MKTLYMTKGLSGSGKTSRAFNMMMSNPHLKRVNKDDLRSMIHNGRWTKSNEKAILAARDALISLFLSQGFDVISDDTNLHPKHETRLRELAHEHGAAFDLIDLTDVPYEKCVANDLKRQVSVGEQVIRQQWLDYICPPLREPVAGLPSCIVFDLDGTVADISHRSPYDASTCEQDVVREHVVAAIRGMVFHLRMRDSANPTVFAFSGRSEKYREQTERWLSKTIDFDVLVMREEGDTRKDAIVKREMFEAHIEGRYNVFAVVDDRPQVLRQWRLLGLPTIDVSARMGMEF